MEIVYKSSRELRRQEVIVVLEKIIRKPFFHPFLPQKLCERHYINNRYFGESKLCKMWSLPQEVYRLGLCVLN